MSSAVAGFAPAARPTVAPIARSDAVWPLRIAIVALVLGNVGRIPALVLEGKAAPISLNDFVLVAALAATAVAAPPARRLRLDGIMAAAALFVAVAAVSTFRSASLFGLDANEFATSASYLARWTLYFGTYIVVASVAGRDDIASLVTLLRRTLLAFAVFGIVQSAFLPNFAQLIYGGGEEGIFWDLQGHRLVSTLLDPNFAGAFIVIAILLELARVRAGVARPWLSLAVLGVALVLTLSRSSVLALGVGVLVMVALGGVTRAVVRAGVVALAAGLTMVPVVLQSIEQLSRLNFDYSAAARIVTWSRGLTLFADHPALGIGFNSLRFALRDYGFRLMGGAGYSLDGGLLFIMVMTGVIGLAAFVVLLAFVARAGRALWRQTSADPEHRALGLATAALIPAIVVHSFFVNSLLLPFVMEAMWLMAGLVAVGRR